MRWFVAAPDMTMEPLRWKPARITDKRVPPHLSMQKPKPIQRKVLTRFVTATYKQIRDIEILKGR